MYRPPWLPKSELVLLVLLCSALFILNSGIVCSRSLRRTREAVLKQDLQTIRMAIDTYRVEREALPQSLQDLVDQHYLPEIPANPFTGEKDWVPTFGNVVLGQGKTAFGIDYVYSSTIKTDSEGQPRLE